MLETDRMMVAFEISYSLNVNNQSLYSDLSRQLTSLFINLFWQTGILFSGGEDRNVTAWDTASGKVAYCIEDAHATRVKGIVVLSKSSGDVGAEDPYIVASASSDGVIRVWDVWMIDTGKPNPVSEVKMQSRLTCLAGSSFKGEYVYLLILGFLFNNT